MGVLRMSGGPTFGSYIEVESGSSFRWDDDANLVVGLQFPRLILAQGFTATRDFTLPDVVGKGIQLGGPRS